MSQSKPNLGPLSTLNEFNGHFNNHHSYIALGKEGDVCPCTRSEVVLAPKSPWIKIHHDSFNPKIKSIANSEVAILALTRESESGIDISEFTQAWVLNQMPPPSRSNEIEDIPSRLSINTSPIQNETS